MLEKIRLLSVLMLSVPEDDSMVVSAPWHYSVASKTPFSADLSSE